MKMRGLCCNYVRSGRPSCGHSCHAPIPRSNKNSLVVPTASVLARGGKYPLQRCYPLRALLPPLRINDVAAELQLHLL